jgi:maltooligosyltrehalose trehalohydrolase
MSTAIRRRAIGAELVDGGVHFRLWAPARQSVSVVVDGRELPLVPEAGGYFSAHVPEARAGSRYRFRLDGGDSFPDPASRFQPDGPHGDSEVVDPLAYRWQVSDWPGVSRKGLVILEVHVGTFTPEGTFAAAAGRLPLLAATGINMIELMPVSEFPGRFGWGYDGVDLFAPTRLYGDPDDFRRFVDAAHAHGIGVILDVVYNHFGPDGCYLTQFTPDYFTEKYTNEWGAAVNYDGTRSEGVREFVAENAAYWIDEFRLDGLRLDATQSVHDSSDPHIVRVIADSARRAAKGRPIFLVAENEEQHISVIERDGIDAMWNDDWHHAAVAALTGKREAYYTDYAGTPQEFISMAKFGFLYQGQRYKWQKQRRGSPSLRTPADRFVCYIENHDQVANSARGARVSQLASAAQFRAMTALLLLAPQTPMLFQGQEFGSSRPFLYFADHKPELAPLVRRGRSEFLTQFRSIATSEIQAQLAPPEEASTFLQCKLDWSERERNEPVERMHRDLIRLRRTDHVFAAQDATSIHGAVLASDCFLLRYFGEPDDRLLIINLGRDLHLDPAPEPLLAPPAGKQWSLVWSSEAVAYGGSGTAELDTEENWRIPAHSAVVLAPA